MARLTKSNHHDPRNRTPDTPEMEPTDTDTATTNETPKDSEPAEPEDSSTSSQRPPRPMKQQARAIQARWAGEEASESDLRLHFESLPLDKALALLAKMRANSTVAGTIINSRINTPADQRCKTCGLTYAKLKESGKPDWWLNRPYYDPDDRNIIHVSHFCSAACVSHDNNKTQGVRGIADRGMLASDNPKNHPRLTHADQTELSKKD